MVAPGKVLKVAQAAAQTAPMAEAALPPAVVAARKLAAAHRTAVRLAQLFEAGIRAFPGMTAAAAAVAVATGAAEPGTGNNPGAAGGGGSGYGSPTLTESFQLVSGSGRTPGNSGHWLRSGAGTGGQAGVSASGVNGRLVIRYEGTEVLASGGTISTDGTYTYHTFTSAGTFSVD